MAKAKFTLTEALELLDESGPVDIDEESEDGEEAQGDFVDGSGSQCLLPDSYLDPQSSSFSEIISPCDKDSLLLLDSDVCGDSDEGNCQ